MTSSGMPVVVATGPDPSHRGAVAWAADEAAKRHAPLHLVIAHGRSARRAVAFVASRHPRLEVSTLFAAGDPVPVLRQRARTAASVVLGSGPMTMGEELFPPASVVSAVISRADCPVVVVPERQHAGRPTAPVVVAGVDVGVDGRRHSVAAVEHGFEVASARGAVLRVLYVWRPPLLGVLDERAALRECRRLLAELLAVRRVLHPDVEVRHEVLRGRPPRVLARESADTLALVMGACGPGRIADLPTGSVVRGTLRYAQCPVIYVPHSGRYRSRLARPHISRMPRRVRAVSAHRLQMLLCLGQTWLVTARRETRRLAGAVLRSCRRT